MNNKEQFKTQVADKLSVANVDKTLLIGFDGFVDEIIEAVDSRVDSDNYTRLGTVEEFGKRVLSFSKVGGNIELVSKYEKLGGNGPIMANALIAMGYPTFYAGNIGYPEISPVFKDMAGKCKEVFSMAQPGHTDAVEFADGKLMLGKTTVLKDVNWDNFVKIAGEKIPQLFSEVSFIAANNWSMCTGMNSIWEGITRTLSQVERKEKVKVFCDLADPRKRLPEDILDALKILTEMNKVADVILGLNKNEGREIASILGISLKNEDPDGIEQLAVDIRNRLDLSIVVIHPIEFACAASKESSASFEGPLCTSPKLSTGAGDNFNAGFCNGLLCGFSLQEALAMGVSSSGYYVRNGYSPNKEQQAGFLKSWANGEIGE